MGGEIQVQKIHILIMRLTHSYGIGADFNHSNELTKNYTKRVIKHWIEEFKIDGFRWDLTKGFTQNCSSGDNSCTDSYQSDRIAILKEYADYLMEFRSRSLCDF